MSEQDFKTDVRALVEKRFIELKSQGGLTMADASRQMRRNAAYIQQYIKKGVPKELSEDDRIILGAILGINPDKLKGLKSRQTTAAKDLLLHISRKLHDRDDRQVESPNSSGAPLDAYFTGSRQLPVYQTWLEGSRCIMARRPFGTLFGLDNISLSNGAYVFQISDDVMSPEHRQGSWAIVDPALKCEIETTCVFRDQDDDGGEFIVRRIRKILPDSFEVYCHNGKPREHSLRKAKWQYAHVVVGNLFRN